MLYAFTAFDEVRPWIAVMYCIGAAGFMAAGYLSASSRYLDGSTEAGKECAELLNKYQTHLNQVLSHRDLRS